MPTAKRQPFRLLLAAGFMLAGPGTPIECSGNSACLAQALQGKVQKNGAVSALERLQPGLASFNAMTGALERSSLPAGLKFEEEVEPVPAKLKLHKLFSQASLPVENGEDAWYQIPAWRAGEFHREKQIDHYKSGDVETRSQADHVYGMQQDKNGGIWHHVSWPSITRVALDGYSQYKIINLYKPVRVNESEFCVKISTTNVDVDDKTGKIIRLAKQEEFDSYYPIEDGVAEGDCFIQGYGQSGRQNTQLESCTVEERRVKPFATINTFRGKDLAESFRNYLQAHNLAQLIPLHLKTEK